MALANLSTTEAYAVTAETANEMLSVLEGKLMEATGTSDMVSAVINKLQNCIDAISKIENDLLRAFGVETEAELQAKFKNFYSKSGLINLSGSMLRDAFVETYRISIDKNMKEMQNFIDRTIVPAMIASMQQEGIQTVGDEAIKIFNQALKGMIINCDLGSGKVVVTRSGNPVSVGPDGIPRILASRLTKEQERRINQLRDYAKTHGGAKITGSITASNNSVIARMTSEWYDLTEKGMSPSQIKDALAKGKITQQQFDTINNKIIGMIGAQTSRPDLVEKYAKKMLAKDPYMFFVGKNANDITGITGEISAVIAISELLVNVDADKIMNWVATNKINDKKLSIDILLEGLGNIQVKNTTLDLATIPLINVDFAQGNIDSILGRLEQGYSWNTEILRSVIESETFNIPAKRSGSSLRETSIGTSFVRGKEPSDWDAFVEAYNLMTSIIARTHTFLTAFAPDFLYIGGPSDFKHQLANLDYSLNGFIGTGIHLYLVGGVPHLASTQLKVIQEDLSNLKQLKDNAMHFNLRSSFLEKGSNLPYTYISYRNNIGAKKARIISSYGFTT